MQAGHSAFPLWAPVVLSCSAPSTGSELSHGSPLLPYVADGRDSFIFTVGEVFQKQDMGASAIAEALSSARQDAH